MSTPIERALAELRAVPVREPAPEPKPNDCPFNCTGNQRGYQWHQRTGNLPACPAAHEAHRTFSREYLREWRKRNPNYHRNWKAKRKQNGGAA